jgi:hypothetical protein
MIKKFKLGSYYHLKWPNLVANGLVETLIKIIKLNSGGAEVFVLANNCWPLDHLFIPSSIDMIKKAKRNRKSTSRYKNNYDYAQVFKKSYEVSQKDLPLYVGWKYVSSEFSKEIND